MNFYFTHSCRTELQCFQFHWKIYCPFHSFGSEKLILWARPCCNWARHSRSVAFCAYQCRPVPGGAQPDVWLVLSLEQAGNGDMFWGPPALQREMGPKKDATIKQREGDKVWSSGLLIIKDGGLLHRFPGGWKKAIPLF